MSKVKLKVKLSIPVNVAGVDLKKGDELTVTDIVTDSNEVTVTKAQAKIMKEHGFIEGEL